MAPSPSSGLLKAFLSVSRLRNCAFNSVLPRLQEPLLSPKLTSAWQCFLHRSLSAGRNGGEDGGDGRNRFREDRAGSFANSRRENSGDEEYRLFGEGGLFGRAASPPEGDELEEHEDDAWDSSPQDQQRFEYTEEDFEGQPWSETRATVEDYVPGLVAESGGDWTAGVPVEGTGGDVSGQGLASEGTTVAGQVSYDEWTSPEETGPSYIGRWGPDGRLLKGHPQTTVDFDMYASSEGAGISQDAAFGDLIRKNGYTDDDIANLLAGFYEPVGLPHLDDYKYIDLDAERREQRREMELAKIAEMAKRWVRKVDEQGFAHAVGRRKTSSARVWIKEGQGRIVINKKHHDMYFVSMDDRVKYLEPFIVTDTMGMFDTFVLVRGGGTTGQAGAIRLGVSRALMWFEPSLRVVLKKAGMLTRDPRMVERKKPGKAKARRSFQWVKR